VNINKLEKITEHIKDVFWFLFLTWWIFIVIFTILNFSSVSDYVSQWFFSSQETEKKINKSINEDQKKQDLFIPRWAKKLVKKEYPVLDLAISPIDSRIIIPKLWINVPIMEMWVNSLKVDKWSDFENAVQGELKKWVVHYPWTAEAGEEWNLFITWHSSYYPWDDWKYKSVFAKLSYLNVWDEYFIFQNQKKYWYKINEKKVVNPNNVSVLKQESWKKLSTLMTCTPVWTALRRLIIKSELM